MRLTTKVLAFGVVNETFAASYRGCLAAIPGPHAGIAAKIRVCRVGSLPVVAVGLRVELGSAGMIRLRRLRPALEHRRLALGILSLRDQEFADTRIEPGNAALGRTFPPVTGLLLKRLDLFGPFSRLCLGNCRVSHALAGKLGLNTFGQLGLTGQPV
jgi:hypothetical protein